MFGWRPVRQYVSAVVSSYQSFVLGLVFAVAGAIGLFVSDQNGVRIVALIGLAIGFLVAPYKAFQRMRWERDTARADSQFDRLGIQLGYVNALSGGGWAIDSFQSPNFPGFVARAIAASGYPLARGTEISSLDMDRFRNAAAQSPLASWFAHRFPAPDHDESIKWKLVTPCNGFEFTVQRNGFVSGGSEVFARVQLLLPRGSYGHTPKLLADLLARDLPAAPLEGGAQPDMFSRFELAGDPLRPDLPELIEILDALAATLTEFAGQILEPIVHRSWRERLRERFGRELPLVGPNFHVRSKPRPLLETLRLPEFPRIEGGYNGAELMIQTPPSLSAYDHRGRLMLIRLELRQLLRTLQYRDFEDYVDKLGAEGQTRASEAAEQSSPAR